MEVSLDILQQLAPDQASINAAKKLLSKSKWPLRGKAASVNTIWGQCQGSGSNPYSTMADVVNYGYKCTCPSRKFPCKHVLALLWQFAESPGEFSEGEPPEWVHDWLGRRRKSDNTPVSATKKSALKLEVTEASTAPLSPEEIAKQEAAKAKRAAQARAKTEASVAAGIEELEQWITDQLRTGIGGFLKEVNERCRRIAARLVDAKATNLASRLDEFPAKIYALNGPAQAEQAFRELGQLVVLCAAWKADKSDPDVRRAIVTTENRDVVLAGESTLRRSGLWQVVGEKIETRRDGLVSHATWLTMIESESAQMALLLDYYPASAGKREGSLSVGTRLRATLNYYPSRFPLRAIPSDQEYLNHAESSAWPDHGPATAYLNHFMQALPWSEGCPLIVGAGKFVTDDRGGYWWQSENQLEHLPLLNRPPTLLEGADLLSAFLFWNGENAELFSAQTRDWGIIPC